MSRAGSEDSLQAIIESESACRQLEELVAELFARLHDAGQEEALHVLHQHVAAARTEREKAAAQFPPAQRARRQAEALLQQNTEEMQKLQAGIVQEEKDIQGLRRSLKKLQSQLQAKQVDLDKRQACMDLLWEEESLLRQQMDSCQQRTDAEHAEQETVAQHVADERTKRMELKAACRQKIKKVEEAQSRLRQLLDSSGAELASLREEVRRQEASTATAVAELARCQEEARRATEEAHQALEAKNQISEEHSEVQNQHGELLGKLEDSRQLLESKTQEDAKALAEWRLSYMSKLDAKIDARRQRQKHLQEAAAAAAAAQTAPKARLEEVTMKPEPVTMKPEPVTMKPEPVTLKPEPVTTELEPVIMKPGSMTVKPEQ